MQRSAPYRPPLLRRAPAAGTANPTPGRCPFLGTPADPGTSLAFPSEANHCFRSRFPIPISSIHQENYCLSSQYETCPVYRQYMTEGEALAAVALPMAAVAVAEPPRGPADGVGSAIAPSMAVGAGMALGAGRATATPFDEPVYPDFPTDPGPEPSPTPARGASRFEGRFVLLALLLLAMLLLAGWAWRTFLDGRDSTPTAAQGTVVTLPTLAADAPTDAAAGNPTGMAIGESASNGKRPVASSKRSARFIFLLKVKSKASSERLGSRKRACTRRRSSKRSCRRCSSSLTSIAMRSSGGSRSACAWRRRVSRTSAMPERRSLRSARSSSVTFMRGPLAVR